MKGVSAFTGLTYPDQRMGTTSARMFPALVSILHGSPIFGFPPESGVGENGCLLSPPDGGSRMPGLHRQIGPDGPVPGDRGGAFAGGRRRDPPLVEVFPDRASAGWKEWRSSGDLSQMTIRLSGEITDSIDVPGFSRPSTCSGSGRTGSGACGSFSDSTSDSTMKTEERWSPTFESFRTEEFIGSW